MTDTASVFERVRQLFAVADEAVMPFCENAAAVINGKIRADVDASDVRLLTAAAAVAFADYLCAGIMSTEDVSYFRAGDITVRKSDSTALDAAESFRKRALADAAELLIPEGFHFRTV